MALWQCGNCGCAYSVGALRCPHCRSTERTDTEDGMPKISSTGEATGGPFGLPATDPEATVTDRAADGESQEEDAPDAGAGDGEDSGAEGTETGDGTTPEVSEGETENAPAKTTRAPKAPPKAPAKAVDGS